MDWSTQINFSNGTSAGDSVQLVFSGSTGLLLPVFTGTRRCYIERFMLKTNYTASTNAVIEDVLPAHIFAATDTNMISVHLVATGTSPRRYFLRIYKMKGSDVVGLAPNLVAAYKTEVVVRELDPLTTGYFPPTPTSVQVRVLLRLRWSP
jgi:hypothetical protein